jgi:hypothetical protein
VTGSFRRGSGAGSASRFESARAPCSAADRSPLNLPRAEFRSDAPRSPLVSRPHPCPSPAPRERGISGRKSRLEGPMRVKVGLVPRGPGDRAGRLVGVRFMGLSIDSATESNVLASTSLSQREPPFPERSRKERLLAETMDEARFIAPEAAGRQGVGPMNCAPTPRGRSPGRPSRTMGYAAFDGPKPHPVAGRRGEPCRCSRPAAGPVRNRCQKRYRSESSCPSPFSLPRQLPVSAWHDPVNRRLHERFAPPCNSRRREGLPSEALS